MQFQLLRAPKNSSYKHDIDIYISYDLDRHLILSNHKKRKWSGLETNIYHLFALCYTSRQSVISSTVRVFSLPCFAEALLSPNQDEKGCWNRRR